jgi:hypothetical protein
VTEKRGCNQRTANFTIVQPLCFHSYTINMSAPWDDRADWRCVVAAICTLESRQPDSRSESELYTILASQSRNVHDDSTQFASCNCQVVVKSFRLRWACRQMRCSRVAPLSWCALWAASRTRANAVNMAKKTSRVSLPTDYEVFLRTLRLHLWSHRSL